MLNSTFLHYLGGEYYGLHEKHASLQITIHMKQMPQETELLTILSYFNIGCNSVGLMRNERYKEKCRLQWNSSYCPHDQVQ